MQQSVESEIPLAGYVIHGNSRSTLRQCVESLQAVCDHVVCVDSGHLVDGGNRRDDPAYGSQRRGGEGAHWSRTPEVARPLRRS